MTSIRTNLCSSLGLTGCTQPGRLVCVKHLLRITVQWTREELSGTDPSATMYNDGQLVNSQHPRIEPNRSDNAVRGQNCDLKSKGQHLKAQHTHTVVLVTNHTRMLVMHLLAKTCRDDENIRSNRLCLQESIRCVKLMLC